MKIGHMTQNIQASGGNIIRDPRSVYQIRFDRSHPEVVGLDGLPNIAEGHGHVRPAAERCRERQHISCASGSAE